MRRLPFLIAVLLILPGPMGARAQETAGATEPEMELARRLFSDARLSHPGSNVQASCASCHTPPWQDASRAFAETKPRSVLPAHPRADEQNLTLRNAPTLLDTSSHPRLNWGGEYQELETLIGEKLTGAMMGWSEGEEAQAKAEIANLLLNDSGEGLFAAGSYKEQFKSAVGADLESLSDDEVHQWVVRVLSNYVRSLKSLNKSPWDAFLAINRLAGGPSDVETPELYAGRILNRIENQTARRLLKRPEAFSDQALKGFEIFFATEANTSAGVNVGNCVVCHIPPTFSDSRFHNAGISQIEYDEVHGKEGYHQILFGQAPTPETADAPSPDFRAIPHAQDSSRIDLGFWNAAWQGDDYQKQEGETQEEYLARMKGAFRTPILRNLERTGPYMHNGQYATLEDVVRNKVEVSRLAKEGKLAGVDPAYQQMTITEEDVAPLVAFLESLNDVAPEEFRQLLINVTSPDFDALLAE